MIFKLTLYFSIVFSIFCLGDLKLSSSLLIASELPAFDLKDTKLNKEEISVLKEKKQLRLLKTLPNKPWPEITYYVILKSPVLSSVALFAAYDIQKKYIPNLLESIPVKNVTPTDVWTRYELRLPFPLKNAKYIHGARLFKHVNSYEVQWYLVESSTTQNLEGEAFFYSLNNEETLMIYRTLVTPKSFMASWVKSSMLEDVEKTIAAIMSFIEQTEKSNRELSTKYSQFINKSLAGQEVYEIPQH